MHAPPSSRKEESPELREQFEASGIEALPKRIDRYGLAKIRALEVVDYIGGLPDTQALTRRVSSCGEYLGFRHYGEINECRLAVARLCTKHLLCPLCAIRRGAKALAAYLPRYEAVIAFKPRLRPFLVTLTVKDGEDLAERFDHLQKSQRELWMRRARKRGSCLDGVQAAVWSYEVKRGKGSGMWHPHLHMVALSEVMPDASKLANEWRDITGDSFIVDVRPIDGADPASGFIEVFKYAVKFSDMEVEDTYEAFRILGGRRLVGSAGLFRGIEIPENLLDVPLDDLEYTELFYRFMHGSKRYELKRGPGQSPTSAKRPTHKPAQRPCPTPYADSLPREKVFSVKNFDAYPKRV